MKHRADIDGLRAVAVIAVLLFHAGVRQVSGGFVGVDVFFVISGYLITGLILSELESGHFSIAHFYERRTRRILPALLTVLLFISVTSYLLLPPDQLRSFGQSLVAAVLFCSNVVFWTELGYFRAPAEMKPLLHTWSLAVEEQFYILYPLFLFVVTRYFRKRYSIALLSVLFLSFGLSVWALNSIKTAAFYLAPFRAWELLLGGLLAIEVIPALQDRRAANALGVFGLLLMSCSFAFLSRGSLFPGVNALYPTLGAALIIYSGSQSPTVVSKVLSLKPVVFIGLISYSLYLWHWVLIVLLKYYVARRLTNWEITAIISVSVGIAALSWQFVENPFRGRRRLIASRSRLFAAAGAASIVFAVFGSLSYATNGFPSRFSPEALRLLASKDDFWQRRSECSRHICQIGEAGAAPSFLLWGDSHAGAIAPVLEHLATVNKISGFVAFNNTCVPVLGLKHYNDENPEYCARYNSSVLDYIKAHHITTVFLHARWALNAEGSHYRQEPGTPVLLARSRNPADNFEEFAKHFRSTIEQLHALQVNVTIIASVPEVGLDVPTMLARNSMKSGVIDFAPRYSDFIERQARTFGVLTAVATEYGAQVVYPHETLCNRSSCSLTADNHPLYIDDNHLSVHGAMQLVPAVAPLLQSFVQSTSFCMLKKVVKVF